MMRFLLLLFCLSCALGCTKKQTWGDAQKLTLTSSFLKKGRYFLPLFLREGSHQDSTDVYHYQVTLKNISTDTVEFIGMSCSYEDLFIVAPADSLAIHPTYLCYKNGPITIALSPGEVYTRNIMVRPRIIFQGSIPSMFGFKFASKHSDFTLHSAVYDQRGKYHEPIVWSPPFELHLDTSKALLPTQ